MKKIILGGVVGGIIMFIWQFLSFVLLDLHRPSQQYTPKQQEVLSYLSTQFDKDGAYFMPTYPEKASREVVDSTMKMAEGKPWAVVTYHTQWESDMTMNMIRGLITDMLMVALFCWLLSRIITPRFTTVLLSSLCVGLIVFLNVPYTNHIWYESFDLMAYLIDAIAGWGLVGLWLGYLYANNNPRIAR